MKNWNETADIFDRLALLHTQMCPAALATIVSISGSTYRRPGAKLLIEADGKMLGNVSGGCLEEDVREAALQVIGGGVPRSVRYKTSDDEGQVWGLGLGCNGEVEIFIQPAPPLELVHEVRSRLEGDEPFAVATRLSDGEGMGEAMVVSRDRAGGRFAEQDSGVDTEGGATWFTDVLRPPPHLVVCGAGDDALFLVRLASDTGFRVTVCDHRSAYATAERFPGAYRIVVGRPEDGLDDVRATSDTYAVVKTHSLQHDRAWIERFLGTPVPYIGLLGPRARRDDILHGVPEGERHRVYGPVGLDLGSEGPEQIALSIVAEVLAVRMGRKGKSLRRRTEPMHGGTVKSPAG